MFSSLCCTAVLNVSRHNVSTLCLCQALGGLAYQAFYQRILSASSYTQAQVTCFASSGFCLVLGIPSILVGAVAASTGTHSQFTGVEFLKSALSFKVQATRGWTTKCNCIWVSLGKKQHVL